MEQEELPHYNSDRGVRIKDESVLLQLDYSGSFITDNISPENLALFFLGESLIETLTAQTGATDTFDDVELGVSYQLGTSNALPEIGRASCRERVQIGVRAEALKKKNRHSETRREIMAGCI